MHSFFHICNLFLSRLIFLAYANQLLSRSDPPEIMRQWSLKWGSFFRKGRRFSNNLHNNHLHTHSLGRYLGLRWKKKFGKMDKNVNRQKMNYKCTVGLLKVGQSWQTFTVHPEDIAFMKGNMLCLIKLLNTLHLLLPNTKSPPVLHTVFLALSSRICFWVMVICCIIKLSFKRFYPNVI